MHPAEFAKRIYGPEDGRTWYVVATLVDRKFHHHYGQSQAWLVETANELDARGLTVFLACARYRERGSRARPNVAVICAFWLDLDVGPGKGYESQREAVLALAEFCRALGLALPLIVNSGRGLHAWFPLAEPLTVPTWQVLADKLKAACEALGLKADPCRTADATSVLRLPGTTNRKDGEARAVRVLHEGGLYTADAFAAALDAALAAAGVSVEAEDLELPEGAPARALAVDNSDLKAGIRGHWFDYLTGEQKDDCLRDLLAQLGHLADADRDIWRDIVAACARSGAPNAFAICREWSATSPKYDAEQFVRDFRSFK